MSTGAAWCQAAIALADKITVDAPGWHDAVAATPRHGLVPRWWRQVPESPRGEWELIDYPIGSPERLPATYSDQTLVTRIGRIHADHAEPDQRVTGEPTSSSTVPSLIVSMAELLNSQPGDRILDVGTGSGYSAALFGHRFGDEQVTSIDLDPYLVDVARDRLAAFGRTPRLEAVDATGTLPEAAVDRIMATVSVRPIPASWLDALQPGGRIVTTIAGTALLIAADMGPDGIARGTVQPQTASFMRTRQKEDYPPRFQSVFDRASTAEGDDVRPPMLPIPDPWKDWQLRNLLELDTPGLEIRTASGPEGPRIVWLLAEDGSWARAEDRPEPLVHQGGPRSLWGRLEEVALKWEQAGRFDLDALQVTLTSDGSTLEVPEHDWTFGI